MCKGIKLKNWNSQTCKECNVCRKHAQIWILEKFFISYLTDMENSPGALSLSLTRKAPHSLCLRRLSATPRDIRPANQLQERCKKKKKKKEEANHDRLKVILISLFAYCSGVCAAAVQILQAWTWVKKFVQMSTNFWRFYFYRRRWEIKKKSSSEQRRSMLTEE